MFDFSTQYSIDENIAQQSFVPDEPIGSKERSIQKISRDSDDAVLVEILKEQEYEGERSEDKSTEVQHEEARRFSGASEFNDMDCGEPATGQHLLINFGMTDEDTIEVGNKCRSFWKFVNSHPHLQDIQVFPRKSTEGSSQSNSSGSTEVRAMKWLKNEEYMKTAMRPKLIKTYCSLNGGDYWESAATTRKDFKKLKQKGSGLRSSSISVSPRGSSAEELKTITKCMDEWDATHCVHMIASRPLYVRDGST